MQMLQVSDLQCNPKLGLALLYENGQWKLTGFFNIVELTAYLRYLTNSSRETNSSKLLHLDICRSKRQRYGRKSVPRLPL